MAVGLWVYAPDNNWDAYRPVFYHAGTGSWKSADRCWAIHWYESSPGVWDYEWIKIGEWVAPDVNVGGISADKTAQLDPPQAVGTWTAISDTADYRYGWSVEVQFYNWDESILVDSWTGAQHLGTSPVVDYPGTSDPDYSASAVLKFRYTNSIGSGPQNSDTVFFT